MAKTRKLDYMKWIHIETNIFENRKIQYIETLPDADTIIVIWLKLLTLAAAINDCGQIYLTREIPFTDEIMAAQFRRPVNTIRLALATFERLGMISIVDDIMKISNWERYQITDADKIREQTRLRVQKHRALKLIPEKQEEAEQAAEETEKNDCNVTVTLCNAAEKKRKEEKRREKNRTEESENDHAPAREACGLYNNVFLTDQEQRTLYAEIGDAFRDYIDDLSSYKQSSGKEYADDFATIRRWAAKDREEDSRNETEDTRWLRMAEAWAKKHEEEDNA